MSIRDPQFKFDMVLPEVKASAMKFLCGLEADWETYLEEAFKSADLRGIIQRHATAAIEKAVEELFRVSACDRKVRDEVAGAVADVMRRHVARKRRVLRRRS